MGASLTVRCVYHSATLEFEICTYKESRHKEYKQRKLNHRDHKESNHRESRPCRSSRCTKRRGTTDHLHFCLAGERGDRLSCARLSPLSALLLFLAGCQKIGVAGLEPAISCFQSRRISHLSHTPRKCPAGVEPARSPWQGDEAAITSWALRPSPNCQRNSEHRVGVEPTSPPYESGVLPARPPVHASSGTRGT